MVPTPETLDDYLNAPKRTALDEARDAALLREGADGPGSGASDAGASAIPSASASFPCGRDWSALQPLIDLLLKSNDVGIEKITFEHGDPGNPRGRLSGLMVDFQLQGEQQPEHLPPGAPGGSNQVVRQWRYAETPLQALEERWASIRFDAHEGGVDRQELSESPADMQKFRDDARLHIRLFTDVLIQVFPEFAAVAEESLREFREWVDQWRDAPQIEKFVLDPEPRNRALSRRKSLDDSAKDKLREFLASPIPCEFEPHRIQFELDKPETSDEDAGVLVDSAELDRAIDALRKISARALVDLRVTVSGFADRLGSDAHNQGLSERRAQWIIDRVRHLKFKEFRGLGHGELHASEPERNPQERYALIEVAPV